MKKNILIYTDTTIIGGAELQMFLLAKFLDKNNFNPILACSNHQNLDSWCKNFQHEEIEVVRLKVNSKHDPRHLSQLKKIIKEKSIDLLHIHIWNPASGRYGLLLSNQIATITTEHDPFALSSLKNFFKKSRLKTVRKIITVSKQNTQLLKELYPQEENKIHLIRNGIDLDWWRSQLLPIRTGDILKTRKNLFKCHDNTFVITTIAALHPRKGLRFLIQSLPEITAKFPNTKLVIIGNGPELNELIHLTTNLNLQNHVIFLGKRKQIPLLLKSSNIFVLPSEREAFGLVLLEAMISRLPIIATATGGIPEIIHNSQNGLIVPPQSPTALTQAIFKLIQDPELCEQLIANGQATIAAEYDARLMADQYEKIYLETLTSPTT